MYENNNGLKKVQSNGYKLKILWLNVIQMSLLHLGAIYGIHLIITDCQFKTFWFMVLVVHCSAAGILCGAHRLWSHRSYKAKLRLQIILAFCQTLALQNDIYDWARKHRVHHKFSETDADPHNAKRGFFFSHVGWLLSKQHPDVKEKGKTVYMKDLENDPLVQFQRKYYIPLVFLIWGFIPTAIPCYFWSESLTSSIFICVFFRYALFLNITWLVNSLAHMWGNKPYDSSISPVQCKIRHLMLGEGYHNYHHTYPWDYSTSEHGYSDVYNPGTLFIDLFAKIGWAYDLKKAPAQIVKHKMMTYGDSSQTHSSKLIEIVGGLLSGTLPYSTLLVLKIAYNYC